MPRRYKPKSEQTPEEWERYLQYHRDYTAAHPEARRSASLRWRWNNIEKAREIDRARRNRNSRKQESDDGQAK